MGREGFREPCREIFLELGLECQAGAVLVGCSFLLRSSRSSLRAFEWE